MACMAFVFCAATAITAPGQTFTTLVVFSGTNHHGAGLQMSLVQGRDGDLYGTTDGGGTNGEGTVFKIGPGGALTTLHSFNSIEGEGRLPCAGPVQATDGNFYGTTEQGGANDYGTVFKITPGGELTTVHSFNGTDGIYPCAPLVQASDGSFYGTTSYGGAHDSCPPDSFGTEGCGTIFKITPGGTLTTLHNFNFADGGNSFAGLVQATDGNFYGTTSSGGEGATLQDVGCGTVFKITPSATLTTLHNFDAGGGCSPQAGLVQGTDGNFYGTTSRGGGSVAYGSIFKISAGGKLSTLHNFDFTDGYFPYAGLVQAINGNFYGTTTGGGNNCPQSFIGSCGVVFTITPMGTFAILHSFQTFAGGFNPYGGLVQATKGSIYGTTTFGGNQDCYAGNGCGTVFRLYLGVAPFVTFQRDSGKVGQVAQILGQGFTGTTSVSFNGTGTSFTVQSDTYLTATVPAGAITGLVTVTTPKGALLSNEIFRVTPQISSFSPTSGPAGATVVIKGDSFSGATEVV
ncbi:MAG: choice-of-anchor tandem repeat GloVer-containing protein, partial [Candidatus Sulfotelmatobacter sp.]